MPEAQIEISPLAYAKIIDWVSSNTEREIGGYLVGQITEDKVSITDSIYATAESNPTHVTLDNMVQFQIIEELEERGSGEVILGWFHSHPGMGCFMSGTDTATHKIYEMLLPEAVAMVNDGNKFAQTQDQNDYEAHFYKVGDSDNYFEVPFNIITDPNTLIELLTRHVQSSENVEKVIDRTINARTIQLDAMLDSFAKEKILNKEIIESEFLTLKKAIAMTRADLEQIDNQLTTKEEFDKRIKSIKKTLTMWHEQSRQKNRKLRKQVRLQNIGLMVSLFFSFISFIGVLILVIMAFLP
jgi:26S proteasome regulatory subunit N11